VFNACRNADVDAQGQGRPINTPPQPSKNAATNAFNSHSKKALQEHPVIFESKPHPRDALATELEKQVEAFVAAGHRIQQIQSGIGGQVFTDMAAARQYQLKKERAKLAPALLRQAHAGQSLAQAARNLKINCNRALLIAQEHDIEFGEELSSHESCSGTHSR